MKVPKFRSTYRLLKFAQKRLVEGRLPPYAEEVFFNSQKESDENKAIHLGCYAWIVGKLDSRLESVLKPSPSSILDYARMLWSHYKEKISEELQNSLAGNSCVLVAMAMMYQERLPKHLEDTLNDPHWALAYSTTVLRGRLPFHLEDIFFKDAEYAAKYAFEVIRGYAPTKLPEHLHSFMIMKSYEDPDNTDIKFYLEASESDPNRHGNSNNTV